jgi:hypothetical protein
MTNIFYPPSQNAIQKTLDAQLLSGITASMTLNNVTGIQNKPGVCVVDLIDANENFTPAKREYISFTGVSGTTLTGLTRNADGGGSDQDHAVGAIVQFPADIIQQQALIDTMLVQHTDEGIHTDALVTTLKATGAEVNTGTEDAKIVTPKSLADSDYITATSAPVTLDNTVTLTNKTLTSPKINEDVALTSSATELNKLDGITFTNGAWTSFVPSWTNLTVGAGGTNEGAYYQVGKLVVIRVKVILGTSPSVGAAVLTLPVAKNAAIPAVTPIGWTSLTDTGTAGFYGLIDSSGALRLPLANSTYFGFDSVSATKPHTWAATDVIEFIGTYEAA